MTTDTTTTTTQANRMLGKYCLVLSNPKTAKRSETITKSLKAHGLSYTTLTEMRELSFSEYERGATRKWTENHECLVIYADGVPTFKAARKAPRNPLYLPFKGPSAVEYVPSDEDLAFFAETASLPDGEATARLAVAA